MPVRRIYADIMELFDGAPTLILDADVAAASSTITVKSIVGATTDQILFFREPGNEKAEIKATHASTSPSGNTVTLAATLTEAHPAGTTIYIIKADKVRFFWYATEVDAETTAPTALAAAQVIDPTMIQNIYDDTVKTSGYYYYQFQDSVNTATLLYSDPIPWGQVQVQFADNEVGYVLEFVRRKLGHEWDDRFSKQTAIDEINACFQYFAGKLKRWSTYQKFNYVLGQTSRGVYTYTLPTDMYDRNTNKSVLGLQIEGADGRFVWKDEKEFDDKMGSAVVTTVRTQPTAADTELDIVNSYSFDATGSVNVYTANTADAITYASLTRSATAGQFGDISATGASAITSSNHVVGTNVWQNEEEGEPKYLNISNGTLRIWPMAGSDWVNMNILLDYSTVPTNVDSESDALDVARYDMIKHWLLWKGKSYWRNNGVDSLKDSDYLQFIDILNEAIRKEVSGQKYKMSPKINSIIYTPPESRGFRYD